MIESAVIGAALGAIGGAVGTVRNPSMGSSSATLANQLSRRYNNGKKTIGGTINDNQLAERMEADDGRTEAGVDGNQYRADGNAPQLGAADGRADVGLAGTQHGENQRPVGSGSDRAVSADGGSGTGDRPIFPPDVNAGNAYANEHRFSYGDMQEVSPGEISRFSAALDESKASSSLGGMVDSQSPEELAGARVFLSSCLFITFDPKSVCSVIGWIEYALN